MGGRRFQWWVGCNFDLIKFSGDFSSVYWFPPNSETFVSIRTVLYCQAAKWITRKPEPTYEQFSQFANYSYVRSHLGNDSHLPIYKKNQAICDTPHQTHCVGNSIFHGDDGVVGQVVVCGWVLSSVQKKTSRRNTSTINLDLTTYDEQEFLSFRIHMAACSTYGRWIHLVFFLFFGNRWIHVVFRVQLLDIIFLFFFASVPLAPRYMPP